eukprot:170088_1
MSISSRFTIVLCIIFTAVTSISVFIVYQIMTHLCTCSNKTAPSSNSNSASANSDNSSSTSTNSVNQISGFIKYNTIICAIVFLIVIITNNVYMLILIFYDSKVVDIVASAITWTLWFIGRIFLPVIFIRRLWLTFKDSAFECKKKTIRLLKFFCFSFIFFFIFFIFKR